MVKVKCDSKDFLELDDLSEFQGNLKARDDGDFEKIAKSIKKHGFSFPFFVWKKGKTNFVLDGHGRLGALRRMAAGGEAIPPLPVVYVKCKDEAEAKEILLKLNSQYGKMTAESVKDFLGDLEIDFEDLALPGGFLDLKVEFDDLETQGDDDAPEADMESEPDSQPGAMYELGNSILMCGDSTSEEDVARLMGGDKADLVFTDPPYGVSYADKNQFLNSLGKPMSCPKRIENDDKKPKDMYGFWCKAFKLLFEFSKDKMTYYITAPQGGDLLLLLQAVRDSGFMLKHQLIWNKNNHVLGRCDYNYKHEPIIYGWKIGETHNFYGESGFKTSVWDIPKPLNSDLHPTMKPIALVEACIKDGSKNNDLILDLFAGSGTTLIAAEKNNRKARVMELDPHYCDVIRKRWTKWAKENGREVGSGGLE